MTSLTLPPLPYAYDALEPWIDEATMRLHHDKHHQAYLDNYLAAVKATPLQDRPVEAVLTALDDAPEGIRAKVRNHGGGFVNHTLFWEIMAPGGGGQPAGELATAIATTFGSQESFIQRFSDAAMSQFGSGWAWLVVDRGGTVAIAATPNQDTPISQGSRPVLGLDVWEHAYYLKYQNRRAEYVKSWWNVVNWPKVADLFAQARR